MPDHNTPTKPTAREKLQPSRLQLELMQSDVNLEEFVLEMKNKVGVDVVDMITDASVERTIEGASTLEVTIVDQDRRILQSGKLSAKLDVNVDGLWFRLAQVKKQGKYLTLIFEDREIAVLRTYTKHIKANRAKVTRAQFILRMLKEVKEFKIRYYIPELNKKQPIEKTEEAKAWQNAQDKKGFGIPKKSLLTVKGKRATASQMQNANIILDVGSSMVLPRKVLVVSIMVAIQESSIQNLLPYPFGGPFLSNIPGDNPVGVFQQRATQGWPASRDVAKDAGAFFRTAASVNAEHPDLPYHQLGEEVQRSGFPQAYAQWRTEAERFVNVYGVVSDNAKANAQGEFPWTTGEYEYYRGIPPTQGQKQWGKESTWDCIQRLADEVNWRAFFVSGTFYYISEPELFKSKPRMTISEVSSGVDWIDFDYDGNKKNSEVTVYCRIGRWQAPPGSIVEIKDCGPINGRWLLTDVRRSLFDSAGTITLKKPRPKLPEPATNTGDGGEWTGNPPTADGGSTDKKTKKPVNELAAMLLYYMDQGRYRDDNGLQRRQLQKLADGETLTNQCGRGGIEVSASILGALIGIIESGVNIGTFALVEDHDCNAGQHPIGRAVDISSLGVGGLWYALNTVSSQGTQLAKQVMEYLWGWDPWDLICNGVGEYQRDVQALQVDNKQRRGGVWASDHTNHIHLGI